MTQSIAVDSIPPEVIATIQFPPGDLLSDEPPLETDWHREQIDLLIRLLKWVWRDREDFYVSGNLTIYYSPNQLKSEHFRGPDFFVILGTQRKDRNSWVVWQEAGKYPNVIVELLSESTASVDKGLKKQIYQDTFRTPDYFWFDPQSLEFEGFHLVDGQYQPLAPNETGWLWSEQLGLFLGVHGEDLRFFTPEGQLLKLPEEEIQKQLDEERERAEQERQRAEQERQRAEQERQRAEQAERDLEDLRARLKAQGIDIS
ncbi:MAG: Uma2 family endonuclease [Acaryochloridaceae cyanobacterium RU_4_10]|nr:Uma2 family endonuclease [Acaryochloridaceae cyanobacterium RU_4_10]